MIPQSLKANELRECSATQRQGRRDITSLPDRVSIDPGKREWNVPIRTCMSPPLLPTGIFLASEKTSLVSSEKNNQPFLPPIFAVGEGRDVTRHVAGFSSKTPYLSKP